jgi:hypothetical protein
MRSGWVLLATTVIATAAVLDIIWGLTALINNEWIVFTADKVWYVDITVWGWITLIVGVLGVIVAWGIYGGQTWARVIGLIVAAIAAINAFLIIPYFAGWGIVILAIWLLAIWALAVHGDEVEAAA